MRTPRAFRLRRPLAVCLAVGAMVGCSRAPAPAPPRAIVFLDIDTLRADHLGCYGYESETSPSIDRLAADSTRFEWAFSQAPNTPPSQASILSSLYPTTHGFTGNGDRLSPKVTTLAEVLSEAGFTTAAFVDGGYMSADFGLDQGFDLYDNSRGGGLRAILPKVERWLGEHAQERFFLLLHTYDTHSPYAPAEPWRSRLLGGIRPTPGFEPTVEALEAVRAAAWADPDAALPDRDLRYSEALYDGEIAFVDAQIGALLDRLRELGLLERSAVFLFSDHGEEFQEHGSVLHEKLYATVTRIPLIVRLPSQPIARTVPEVVESIDIMPTVLELVGADPPSRMQGSSLVPLLRGARAGTARPAFSESPFFGGRRAVAYRDWRMLSTVANGRRELYRFQEDPDEQLDLAAAPDVPLDELSDLLRSFEERARGQRIGGPGTSDDAPDDQTLRDLRALGYLGSADQRPPP